MDDTPASTDRPDDNDELIILVGLLMNEMAVADKMENLEAAHALYPNSIDIYARYAAAALRVFRLYRERPLKIVDQAHLKKTPAVP